MDNLNVLLNMWIVVWLLWYGSKITFSYKKSNVKFECVEYIPTFLGKLGFNNHIGHGYVNKALETGNGDPGGNGDPSGNLDDEEEGGGGFSLIINGHSLVRTRLHIVSGMMSVHHGHCGIPFFLI